MFNRSSNAINFSSSLFHIAVMAEMINLYKILVVQTETSWERDLGVDDRIV
jgi:hypothetical protein